MSSLTGRVAVVTGASSGLGRRFAHLLSDAGASVALMARREDRLASEVEAIKEKGGKAIALPLDVVDAEAIGPALDKAQDALGPISIMVNNAGVGGDGAALTMPVERFDNTFDVNVRGVFYGAREAASRMINSGVAEREEARIINIAGASSGMSGTLIPSHRVRSTHSTH